MTDHDIFSTIRRDPVGVFIEKLKSVDFGINAHGKRSMLHMAIAYERPKHAELLISRGANLDSQDKDGQTPLDYAAIHGQLETARLLVERKADQSICDRYGNSALWYAVFNAREQYDLVRLYLNAGGSATQKNKAGKSPLDFAKQISDIRLQEILSAK